MTYIEDLLHLYVDNVGVKDPSYPILTSISKQCKKGIAMTDRQYELVKNKLLEKSSLLQDNISCNLEECLNPRMPLRHIDRSKYITVVSHTEMLGPNSVYESYKEKWKWIKIRFPFSKKDIVKLESIVPIKKQYYQHKKGSHEHFYFLHPIHAFKIVEAFKNRGFDIDVDILNLADAVKEIVENKSNHILSKDNFEHYLEGLNDIQKYDRSHRYGFISPMVTATNLTEEIAFRGNRAQVLAHPQIYSISDIALSLKELNRFPLMVCIDVDNAYGQLAEWHNAFDIPNHLQSVLFRVDNNGDKVSDFNQYIKDNSLNNWVDENTKIVYINKQLLPKLLLKTNFKPICAVAKTSTRCNSTVQTFIDFYCDLIIYNDEKESMFNKSRNYSFGIL